MVVRRFVLRLALADGKGQRRSLRVIVAWFGIDGSAPRSHWLMTPCLAVGHRPKSGAYSRTGRPTKGGYNR
jgi:hypothetical protein